MAGHLPNGIEKHPLFHVVEQDERDRFPAVLRGKHVVLATETLGPVNGVSRTTGSLIDYLRKNGVQVAVAAPYFKEKPNVSRTYPEVQVRLGGYPLPYNPDLSVAYPFRFDRVFKRTFAPDVVYLASPASVGFQCMLHARLMQDSPVVLCNFQTDLSAYSDVLFPKYMARYSVWMLGAVQGYLFSHPSVYKVFYPSSGIREYLEDTGTPGKKLVQLGRGVDTVLFNPSQRDEAYRRELAPNGEIILLCVCRIAPEKGFEFLAQVAERLARESLPFKLVIVGGNKNPAVEDKVHGYFDGVKDKVVFTGFKGGNALAREYASADLFLHCSITETFGLVVLEAMASGTPVVARDQGGPSEIVREGKTGYLVPPTDLELFVSMVRRISQDPDLRYNLSIAAREQAEDTTWEKINMRAAWYLADGMELHQKQARTRDMQRRSQTLYAALYQKLREEARLHFAVGVVSIFWIIAVLPLMVHGNIVYYASGWTIAGMILWVQRHIQNITSLVRRL